MKTSDIRKALQEINLVTIIGSSMPILPHIIIDLILYYTYSYTYSYKFKNREELRTAVRGYPGNMETVWRYIILGCFKCSRYELYVLL